MLSSESLLLALNSGCLNSHACASQSQTDRVQPHHTNPWSIWRLPILLVIVPHFVKVVLVELSDETGEIAVLEVFREY